MFHLRGLARVWGQATFTSNRSRHIKEVSNTCPRMRSLTLLGGLALMTATLLGPGPSSTSAAGQAKEPAVSAGWDQSCAVAVGGGLKCWGGNGAGQLGDGTNTDRLSPVDVSGLTSGVAAVTAGGGAGNSIHTCALTTAGGVKCWGSDFYGQLGNGPAGSSLTPVDVCADATCISAFASVAAVVAGDSHTCALTTAGGVKCWGKNSSGQLGDGTTTQRTTPVNVSGLTSGIIAIASEAGTNHTCALTTAGGVKCWGNNFYGQLGAATPTCGPPIPCSTTPVDVTGLASGAAAIGVGQTHSCAVMVAGGVKCWGSNNYGQLGNGTTTDSTTPADVLGLTSGVAAVSGGQVHTCALTTAGGVKCWGQHLGGQLGVGPTTTETCGAGSFIFPCSTTPLDVCADGATPPCTAANSNNLTGVTAVDAGINRTCATIKLGLVMCWGGGYLGNGTPAQRNGPVNVAGLSSSGAAVAAGYLHACARTTVGGLKCWGWNTQGGALGDGQVCGPACPTPVDVSGLTSGVASIAAGGLHTCAVTTGGGVKCWGDTADSTTPVDVVGLQSGVVAVAAGWYHTCALTATGGVKCWGRGNNGQLGDGTATSSLVPVDVSGLTSGVASIAAGAVHTCAVMAPPGGGVKCWGDNESGQLGDGTSGDGNFGTIDHIRTTPGDVCAGGPQGCTATLTGVATVAAGNQYTCAVTAAGAAKCWGINNDGQLGDGTAAQRTTPVDVCAGGLQGCTTPLTNAVTVGAGLAGDMRDGHTCAVMAPPGGVKCWGEGLSGQLGNGTTTQRATPTDVLGLGSGVTAVALGGGHSCAVTAGAGGVRCWGSDGSGQLGIGIGGFSSTPVEGAVVGADTDGDGLLDDWETNGIDYNGDTTVDFVLPGANPNHKDVYVEVDWMVGGTPSHSHDPDDAAIQDVINAFAGVPNALLNNPDGQPGITLHVTQDEAVAPYIYALSFDSYPNQLDFADFKLGNPPELAPCDGFFGQASERTGPNCANILGAKRLAYHYAIFGDRNLQDQNSSGIAELPGNDFFVTLGAFAGGVGTRDQQAGTFMHELGHNLGLRHGGGDSLNRKPNYLSVMNYFFQFPILCPVRPLDYSRAALPPLNENSLNEPTGIGGPPGSCTAYGPVPFLPAPGDLPIDWNRNGILTDTGVQRDISNDNRLDTLLGYGDWANVQYGFRPAPSFATGVYDTGGESPDLAPAQPPVQVGGVTELTMTRASASREPRANSRDLTALVAIGSAVAAMLVFGAAAWRRRR